MEEKRTGLGEHIERAVREGSPLSPALLNLPIDPLAYAIQERRVDGVDAEPITLFAYDLAVTAIELPAILSSLVAYSRWTDQNGLSWSADKSHIEGSTDSWWCDLSYRTEDSSSPLKMIILP